MEYLLTSGRNHIGGSAVEDNGTPIEYNRWDITHLESPIMPDTNEPYYKIFEKWKDAVMSADITGTETIPVKVYESDAKAVLMSDVPTEKNDEGLIPEPGESQ